MLSTLNYIMYIVAGMVIASYTQSDGGRDTPVRPQIRGQTIPYHQPLRHIKKTPPLPERQGGVRKGNEWDKEQGGSAGICLPAVCYPVVPAHHARACDAALHETVAAALPAFNFPVADRSRQAVF